MAGFHEGKWLKEQVARAGLSQLKFAEKNGIPTSTLTTWFGLERLSPRRDLWVKLAAGLGSDPEALDRELEFARLGAAVRAKEEKDREVRETQEDPFELLQRAMNKKVSPPKRGKYPPIGAFVADKPLDPPVMREVPIINKIAAGPLTERTDLDYPAGFADDYVRMAIDAHTEAFALWVDGESMSPRFEPGDLVVFRAMKVGDPIEEGRDYAIQLKGEDGGASTLKRVAYHPKLKNVIVAMALNPAFTPRSTEIPLARVARLGRVMVIISGNR